MTRMFLVAIAVAVALMATVAVHAQEPLKLPTQQETLAKWPWSIAVQPAPFQQQRVQFTLKPTEGMEYKYRLEKGANMVYTWSATGDVLHDMHGEADGASPDSSDSFDNAPRRRGAGALTAPFSGIHGWFWENRTGEPITITLTASGFFTDTIEFRSGQRPLTTPVP